MHNLPAQKSVGNDHIAVVPPSDERIEHLAKIEAFAHLVSSFTDSFGRNRSPSLIIAKDAAAKTEGAIIDFRNALAMAAIARSWEFRLIERRGGLPFPDYSGYFDLYPYMLSKDNDSLIANSPSVLSVDTISGFRGQTAPELARVRLIDDWYDSLLLSALLDRWRKRHIKRRNDLWQRAVFRSLEMAFRAATIPYSNRASLNDYGAQIALWVSALEILVWPAKGRASLEAVLNLLGRTQFHNKLLRAKRYSVALNRKAVRANLLQKLYAEMNSARNDFLHGNRITIRSLFPWHVFSEGRTFCAYAPVVYKSALYAVLFRGWPYNTSNSDLPMGMYAHRRRFEEALVSACASHTRSR